jgi:signal transduction histidine kinase
MAARDTFDGQKMLLSGIPATYRQRLSASITAVAILIAFGVVIPFASIPLRHLSDFASSTETAIIIIDLFTSVLLFSQVQIDRSLGLLVLASGYLFAALVAIPHALSFPQYFSPSGIIDSGFQDTASLFLIWQGGFSLALLAYVWLKDKRLGKTSQIAAIYGSAAIVIVLVCAIVWMVTAGHRFLPHFYHDQVNPARLFRYAATSALLITALALVLLWARRRTALDQWLIVVCCAVCAQQAFAGPVRATRYSAGFYAGHTFLLIASGILLIVLITEITQLYGRVARSNAMLQRERNNKLMTLEAMVRSIAHEVKQPLTAISMNSEAAMAIIEQSPPDIEEVRSALNAIVDDSHRASGIFDNIRSLFRKSQKSNEVIDVNDLVLRVLGVLKRELKDNRITSRTELAPNLPPVVGHEGQLQEVIINLVQNAIDAMASTPDGQRVLRIATKHHGNDEIAVSVSDSGHGIDPSKIKAIFESFMTTKEDGMGLGLAISRAIIERHEGELSASAVANGGALLRFTLPIKTEGSTASPCP